MKKYLALFKSLGWRESKEYFYGDRWKSINGMTKIDLSVPYNDENLKAATARITEPVYFRLSGTYFIEFSLKAPKKTEKAKKKTKTELMEEARKKQTAELDSLRIEICDLYVKHIMQIPEKRINDLTDKDCRNLMTRLFQILIEINGAIRDFEQTYYIKTNVDLKNLKEDFKNYDILQKLMLMVWGELASPYSNKLVEWNFTKNTKILAAHKELYSILTVFGFKLDADHKAVIEGTSDLYNVKV